MTTTIKDFDEKRRNDPAIRAGVERVLSDRAAAIAKAEVLLDEAYSLLMQPSLLPSIDDSIYDRVVSMVARSRNQLSSDKRFISEYTETYIGNVSTSYLGAAVAEEIANSY